MQPTQLAPFALSPYGEAGPATIVIAHEADRRQISAVLQQMGARLVANLDWPDLPARLDGQAWLDLLIADCAGLPQEQLADALALLTGPLADGRTRTIVSVTLDQLDEVGAILGWDDLLCDPSPAELETALAVALAQARRGQRLNDASREEAARKARITEEVARFTETLTRIALQADRLTSTPLPPVDVPDQPWMSGEQENARLTPVAVRNLIRTRRLREQYLGEGLFADPAWDILLDLFASELEQHRVSVSSLCIAAAVPPTTALRWVTAMIESGLLERRPDPLDRRRAFVALSARTEQALRDWWAAAGRLGLWRG